MAVNWGMANRDLSGVEAIGVDEIQWRRGHKYLTLVRVHGAVIGLQVKHLPREAVQ